MGVPSPDMVTDKRTEQVLLNFLSATLNIAFLKNVLVRQAIKNVCPSQGNNLPTKARE